MFPEHIEFTKLTAGGNDFLCLDNTDGRYDAVFKSAFRAEFVRRLCRRGLSIGADGMIVACERGSGAGIDIVARFLEPDGSEARLCGNGTACFVRWVLDRGLVQGPVVQVLTAAGTAQGQRTGEDPERIRVCVPDPHDLDMDMVLPVHGTQRTVHYLDTGVPHLVQFVRDVDQVDVAREGAALRHHPRFERVGGVNANFVQILDVGHIAVRTFEFGVEAETLACGTGSSAAAIIAALREAWPEPYRRGEEAVRVRVRGEEELRIWFCCRDEATITDVCLETRPVPLYEGVLRPELVDALRRIAEHTDSHAPCPAPQPLHPLPR